MEGVMLGSHERISNNPKILSSSIFMISTQSRLFIPHDFWPLQRIYFVLMCFLVTQFWNTFPNCLLKNTSHEITQKEEKKVSAPKLEFSRFLSQTNIHRLSKLFVVLLPVSARACYASLFHWYKLLFFLNMSINIAHDPEVNYARLCCIAPEKTLRDSCLIILGRININTYNVCQNILTTVHWKDIFMNITMF